MILKWILPFIAYLIRKDMHKNCIAELYMNFFLYNAGYEQFSVNFSNLNVKFTVIFLKSGTGPFGCRIN